MPSRVTHIEDMETGETKMLKIERHANVWMVVRANSEGTVTTLKSFTTEGGAKRFMARVA